jgi:hypothetical protein
MKMKMKTRFYKPVSFLCAAALLAAVLLASAACEAGTGAYEMNREAVLYNLGIGNVRANAPAAITPEVWNDWDTPNILGGEGAMIVNLQQDEDMVNILLKPSASKNARIAWGIGDQINRPAEFYDYRVPANFRDADYIYIRVTSEDTARTAYYRFYIFLMKKGTNMAELFVNAKFDDDGRIIGGSGRRAEKSPASPSLDFRYFEAGLIDLTKTDAADALLTAIGFEDTSTFRFAQLPHGSEAEPVFGTNTRMVFTDLDMLYVEVTAQNTVDKAFYKFVVTSGRIANLTLLKFDDIEVTSRGFPNAVWGSTLAGSFESADMPDVGYTIGIAKEDPKSTVDWQLVKGNIYTSALPATGWEPIAELTSAKKAVFDNTNFLVIRVTSEDGMKTRHGVWYDPVLDAKGDPVLDPDGYERKTRREGDLTEGIRYYKIGVELLAANFTEHPISTVYYYWKNPTEVQRIMHVFNRYDAKGVLLPEEAWTEEDLTEFRMDDDNEIMIDPITKEPIRNGVFIDYASPRAFPSDDGSNNGVNGITATNKVKPLGFKLDKTIPATATYRWYESNSWYGGYGFDPDGYRCYNIPNSKGVIQFNYEEDFTSDAFHARQFDEKGNPTLFNGGNQAARYPLVGREIPDSEGGNQATYTPRIDYRPFLGYSYETHYYWVVVTFPNGKKATSGRAAIVSERNPDRRHLVIDVNNAYKPNGATSRPVPFRNGIAFKEKYDKFRIPLDGMLGSYITSSGLVTEKFDMTKWKILTAQAIFYLTDGTEWIQNWTNGNLSFEDNSADLEETDPPYNQYGPVHPKGTMLGLFYNLTNQNGTYDITSDVKEGSPPKLPDTTPTHIVIEPSGDHTKGPNKDGYPSLVLSDGKMVAAPGIVGKDLQGWFCGYIKLVELRFEGPR